VPLRITRPDLFPDDTNPLPSSGSKEQELLLADELDFGTETYLERLQQLSDVTDNIYPELVATCRNVTAAALPGRPLRVLDLCSGVGVVTMELVRGDLPIERVTLADLSPELLRRAVAILGKRLPRLPALDTAQVDLLADELAARVTGPFDLVVTCNAFQHFPRERQAALFRQIHELLAPSGVFVFESHFKQLRPNWKQAMMAEYQAKLRRAGAPDAAIQNATDHIMGFHNYIDLRDAYNWLEAARFGVYECTFRKDEIGIFAAVK
jgi:SAM-dependent methyltransferase